jgi:Outer membrane protein beta-barrel domain
MKRITILCIGICTLMTGFAQTDSTGKPAPDTIHVGSMVIIREKDSKPAKVDTLIVIHKNAEKLPNVSTNWLIIDLGFANYNDKTNAASPGAQAIAGDAYNGTPGNPNWAKLRGGRSRSVNIWLFMQRINLINHAVNLKYGLGIELNNYFFDDKRVRFAKNPTKITLDPDLANAKKNKLAADYLTLPAMLNFNFTPRRRHNSYGFSAGVSAGYLYSARQKTKIGNDVSKTKSDFDLERWKFSYVAEVLLGPVKLYGSYAFKSMWEKGLDQRPYTVGFRISSW